MQSRTEGKPHQLVVRGVIVNLVEPVAVAVVGAQFGRMTVGIAREDLHLLAAHECAEFLRARRDPFRTVARDRVAEHGVFFPGIEPGSRRRLIQVVHGGWA